MNRVEVFATSNQLPATGIGSRVVQIDVPGASSADLSTDGTTVWVGTITQQIVAINTTSLQIQSRYSIQPLSPVPNTTFDRPEELLVLAGGDVAQIFGYGLGTDANLPTVTIGGATATVQKVETIAAIEPSLGLDSTSLLSLLAITLQTPPANFKHNPFFRPIRTLPARTRWQNICLTIADPLTSNKKDNTS